MVPFSLQRVVTVGEAVASGASHLSDDRPGLVAYLAGGTDLMQLMKEQVRNPSRIVHVGGLYDHAAVQVSPSGLRLGAMVRMSAAAGDPAVRAACPVVAEALLASASPQVRNMAMLGGNLLQRTRCGYFRDAGVPCNKRHPGSGCPAREGANRANAIFGASAQCSATYAGDFANALLAVDAVIYVAGLLGARAMPVADLHRPPGETPQVETCLQPGDLIVAIEVPASAHARRSHYLKVRDRTSFAFALASAAVALDLQPDGTVRDARVAVGGVATTPWRLPAVEDALRGRRLDHTLCRDAGALAADGAQPLAQNGTKVKLVRRVVTRALAETGGLA